MIDLMIHEIRTGVCELSGKEAEGVDVTFKDGTTKEGFMFAPVVGKLPWVTFISAWTSVSARCIFVP